MTLNRFQAAMAADQRPPAQGSGGVSSGNRFADALAAAPVEDMGDPISVDDVRRSHGLDSLTFGLSNRIPALLAGAGAALTGGNFGDVYSARVRATQDYLRRGALQHPNDATLGEMAGFVPWMLVPVGGEIAGAARLAGAAGETAGAARAGGLLSKTGRFLAGENLPGMRELRTWGAGRGLGAAAAQYGAAGYTGGVYGALSAVNHADPGQEAGAILPGAAMGAAGGMAFRGAGTILGAPENMGARAATGAGVGAALGGGAAALNHQDVLQGVEAGGVAGAVGGALARPTLLGWMDRNPVVRTASGGALGALGGASYAVAHNIDPRHANDAPLDISAAAGTGLLAGAAIGGAGRPAVRMALRMGEEEPQVNRTIAHTVDNNFFDANVNSTPSISRFNNFIRGEGVARMHGRDVPRVTPRDLLNGAAPPGFHDRGAAAIDLADLLHHGLLGMARRSLLGQSRFRQDNELKAFLDRDLRTPESRDAFRAILDEVLRIEAGRAERGANANTYGMGAGGASSWQDLQDQFSGSSEGQ